MRVLRFSAGNIVIFGVLMVVAVMLMWQGLRPCKDFNPVSCVYEKAVPGPMGPVTPSQITPVYVIEEHHEALLYWFDAANKGLIKRQGNVLLHIDGHSDGGTPEDRKILSLFRWPGVQDIVNMMQRNDVFIVAAAYTGIIRRYIWVWSPWDITPREPTISDHHVIPVQLGTVSRQGHGGRMFQDICICMPASAFDTDDQSASEDEVCFMPNITHLNYENIGVNINRDRCRIQIRDGVIEIVSENKAIELMRTGTWITTLDSVILDIDEDYYGCEAAVQPLYDVGLTEKNLGWVQFLAADLFCASTTSQEQEADKFYASIIDHVVHLKQFCSGGNEKLCKDETKKSTYIARSVDVLYGNLQERKLEKTLCRSDKKVKITIRNILNRFSWHSTEQLLALKEVGICLMGSPRTITFDPRNGMRICDGYNRPNNTAVMFYTPTVAEVSFRTKQLTSMLNTSGLHPGVVTVCRSMRDGYTPRKLFNMIERDVIDLLTEVFPHIDTTAIFYDTALLGGAYGWPNRH